MNRKTAESLHAELTASRTENERLAAALARLREEMESRGPTPRETAQAEKFRIHLQRLQRDLESARKERDAVRAAAGRAEREEEEAREARRMGQRSQGTQVGGSGELAVAAEDTAGVLQFELQSQAEGSVQAPPSAGKSVLCLEPLLLEGFGGRAGKKELKCF